MNCTIFDILLWWQCENLLSASKFLTLTLPKGEKAFVITSVGVVVLPLYVQCLTTRCKRKSEAKDHAFCVSEQIPRWSISVVVWGYERNSLSAADPHSTLELDATDTVILPNVQRADIFSPGYPGEIDVETGRFLCHVRWAWPEQSHLVEVPGWGHQGGDCQGEDTTRWGYQWRKLPLHKSLLSLPRSVRRKLTRFTGFSGPSLHLPLEHISLLPFQLGWPRSAHSDPGGVADRNHQQWLLEPVHRKRLHSGGLTALQ